MKHNHVLYLIGIIGLAALLIMLTSSSPTEIGPFGVLLFFTTIYIVLFCFFSVVLQIFRKIALKKTNLRKKDYFYAAIISFGPIMFLLARSFGSINPWTVFLIIIFLSLAEFLVYKRI